MSRHAQNLGCFSDAQIQGLQAGVFLRSTAAAALRAVSSANRCLEVVEKDEDISAFQANFESGTTPSANFYQP